MNSTVFSICVALAIIILSEGKYLLVSVEESGVSRLQSRESFMCDDQPSVYWNKKTLKRLFPGGKKPGYKTNFPRIDSCAPFNLADKHPTRGNYIAYEVIPQPGDETRSMGTLNIVDMKHLVCDVASPKCQCEGMLSHLFEHVQQEAGSGKKIYESVGYIDVPTNMAAEENFYMTCLCVLQAAKDFKYFDVVMPNGTNGCEAKVDLNGRDPTEVCGEYRHKNCYNNRIVISTQKLD